MKSSDCERSKDVTSWECWGEPSLFPEPRIDDVQRPSSDDLALEEVQ